MKKITKVCRRGHQFEKSSDCPVCPVCWPGYQKRLQSNFPKISAPALRALNNAKIKDMSALTKWTQEDILKLHGMGPKAVAILKAELKKQGKVFKKN